MTRIISNDEMEELIQNGQKIYLLYDIQTSSAPPYSDKIINYYLINNVIFSQTNGVYSEVSLDEFVKKIQEKEKKCNAILEAIANGEYEGPPSDENVMNAMLEQIMVARRIVSEHEEAIKQSRHDRDVQAFTAAMQLHLDELIKAMAALESLGVQPPIKIVPVESSLTPGHAGDLKR